MIIDSRAIEPEAYPGARFRVNVHEEQEHISNPRDWWPNAGAIDVAMWNDSLWSYVWVQVILLHGCDDCGEHESSRSASLGMVAFGSGDGWTVGIDQIIVDHPVPELIEEIMSS